MTFKPITTNDLDLEIYEVGFTRVTELLAEPADVRTAAGMFVDELKDDYALDFEPVVLHAKPLFPGDEKRDEIEYTFTVLMSRHDVEGLEDDAPYSFHLMEYTR